MVGAWVVEFVELLVPLLPPVANSARLWMVGRPTRLLFRRLEEQHMAVVVGTALVDCQEEIALQEEFVQPEVKVVELLLETILVEVVVLPWAEVAQLLEGALLPLHFPAAADPPEARRSTISHGDALDNPSRLVELAEVGAVVQAVREEEGLGRAHSRWDYHDCHERRPHVVMGVEHLPSSC